jgi:integrase
MTGTLSSPTTLDRPIADWIAHQRALGRGFSVEERVLDSLRRCFARQPGADLDQGGFDCWCGTLQHLDANTRRARQMIVHRFCLFRRRTDPTCFVPDPLCFSRPHPYRDPVIVTPGQVARMLAAANSLEPTPDSPLRPAVMRIALVLLYTAGLRRGELLRLTLDDIDPRAGVLQIRASKFHKSRLAPLSPDACRDCGPISDDAWRPRWTRDRRDRCCVTPPADAADTPERAWAAASMNCSRRPGCGTTMAAGHASTTCATASRSRR